MQQRAYTITLIRRRHRARDDRGRASGARSQGIGFTWDVQNAGAAVAEREGTPLPDAVLDSIRANGVALKGRSYPHWLGLPQRQRRIRKALDLYANVRPALTPPACPALPARRSARRA